MRFYKAKIILLTSFLVVGFIGTPAQAGDGVLFVAADHTEGYDRALFKLWVDADKNGCDTRAEVLIKEAVVKPKKGANCKLTGGKWVSSYDGVTYTDSSKLDIDHLVPLAEAWRSGAWAWTDKQREEYANYLENERALNAVTASVNRSKGDKDIASWLPKKNVCDYLAGWVTVKANFQLMVDASEAKIINKYYTTCGLGWITKESVTPVPVSTQTPVASASPAPISSECLYGVIGIASVSVEDKNKLSEFENSLVGYSRLSLRYIDSINKALALITETKSLAKIVCKGKLDGQRWLNANDAVTAQVKSVITSVTGLIQNIQAEVGTTLAPTPSSQDLIVTPGAFCSPAGAIGKSTSGVTYTCKTSPTDSRNRWRQ